MTFQKKNNYSKFFLFFIILLLIAGVFVYTSSLFERNKPIIKIADEVYWNLKTKIKLNISDDMGVKYYKIVFVNDKIETILKREVLKKTKKNIEIDIEAPRLLNKLNSKESYLYIEVQDTSKWNFLSGNKTSKKITIHIDQKRPYVEVLSHSYGLRKGGSALVIFRVDDENLKDVYIRTPYKDFKALSFYKKNYYISLIARPIYNENFYAFVLAKDKANNISKSNIMIVPLEKKYRLSKIKLKKSFINGIVNNIASKDDRFFAIQDEKNEIKSFKFVNETLRKENEDIIHNITKNIEEDFLKDFNLSPFVPLRNSAFIASFGDKRKYILDGKTISEAYHLGLDLASVRQAKMYNSNDAKVVFARENGIYGNTLILYHGLGLYSLYAHTSSIKVNENEFVKKGMYIANTGMSGLVLGDHLHFTILVQGIEVRPFEWMDKKWIKLNVLDVIKDAKKIIDG